MRSLTRALDERFCQTFSYSHVRKSKRSNCQTPRSASSLQVHSLLSNPRILALVFFSANSKVYVVGKQVFYLFDLNIQILLAPGRSSHAGTLKRL
jgi:hypothetical protein